MATVSTPLEANVNDDLHQSYINYTDNGKSMILSGNRQGDSELMGLKYGHSMIRLEPGSNGVENGILIHHYQNGVENGMGLIKQFQVADGGNLGYAGNDIILAKSQDMLGHANGNMHGDHDEESSVQHDGQNGVSNESMRELEDLLTKLNPFAKEFVAPSFVNNHDGSPGTLAQSTAKGAAQRKNGYAGGRKRVNTRTSRAQRDDSIRRTVYVSDIDQQVTEEQLAALFITCGQVVDCRVCGDPNSVLRFAFVEFTDDDGARAALSLTGTVLGYYPVRVLPSKTAIAPVNPTFLPRSEDEREMCARTIYCTNIDKKVTQADVKLFFESLCGEVARLRLLGDYHHSTRIAFVEFIMAESAMAALNCSGAILGSLPIRVSPSKTPVRPRSPRPPIH
eukprot:TRINITY_DN21524_c0_g1_i1.p1 TRINITY_DN21524_c0_g1~~TRINITY_DN21524_c0_g1_i1.p1  ORF type:complete len:394 (-),score=68.88 TRINITY_DN21524_c0_g1_i1:1408-2589(-)